MWLTPSLAQPLDMQEKERIRKLVEEQKVYDETKAHTAAEELRDKVPTI